ncbi:hypothetical protein ACIOK4_42795 [Streptomyces bottropensis]|uniref:hypothetical protein n=1 Tax=Streptomyces bottropensis TaxID=42235 RepID=UPI0037AFA133
MDKSPEHRPTPEDLLSLLAETGTFSLRQRATPPMGRAYLALTLALACYFCAFLVTMAVRHGSGFLAVPALAFGMFSSLFVITKLHGLRWINVQATVDGWGLRLRYGDTRVEHPWEELTGHLNW